MLFILLMLLILFLSGYWIKTQVFPKTTIESNHNVLLEKIEAMGKLQLVKYRYSDVIEHINKTDYLPEASVLLIIKADAVGCIDLTKIDSNSISVIGDSVHLTLPKAEICYIKIDHKASKVYDTKMAFFREANLVDEAYKFAENEIAKQVRQSDILTQTQNNALPILKPFIEGLGYKKIALNFN
jgi:hypothetical protein